MNGILILGGKDRTIEKAAQRDGLKVAHGDDPAIPFDKTLIVQAGAQVPWGLLPAAWHFLDRWDAAVPLWRYGVTADDMGTSRERRQTVALVRDLRVLLYSHELLFVRDNDAGRSLVAAFEEELAAADPRPAMGTDAGGERLAFLRAMYRVKPRLCVLPQSWLADVMRRSVQDARAGGGKHVTRKTGKHVSRKAGKTGKRLVRVELSPGRFVQCYPGDEETVKAQWAQRQQGNGRRGRNR